MRPETVNAVKILTALAVSAALAGCASMERTVECAMPPMMSDGKPMPRVVKGPALVGEEYGLLLTPIPLDSVIFMDNATASQVVVQSMRTSRTATNTVRLDARLFNCSRTPLEVQARVSFLLANQAPAESESAWRSILIQPGAMANFSEQSLSGGDIAHYLVEIGLAR